MWTCCGGAAGAEGAAGAGGGAEASTWTCAVRPEMACIMAAKPAAMSADELKEVGMPPAGGCADIGREMGVRRPEDSSSSSEELSEGVGLRRRKR